MTRLVGSARRQRAEPADFSGSSDEWAEPSSACYLTWAEFSNLARLVSTPTLGFKDDWLGWLTFESSCMSSNFVSELFCLLAESPTQFPSHQLRTRSLYLTGALNSVALCRFSFISHFIKKNFCGASASMTCYKRKHPTTLKSSMNHMFAFFAFQHTS